MPSHEMNRRDALRGLTAGIGAASAVWIDQLHALARQHPMSTMLAESAQGAAWTPRVLSAHQLATVGTLVELIIPATETPGAKALEVDRYIDGVLALAEPADRDRFLSGLGWLDARSQALFRKDFVSSSIREQTDLLTRLSSSTAGQSEPPAGVEFFNGIKTLTIAGYYTTEVGLRQELGDDGRMMLATFEGCTHKDHGA